MESCVMSPLVLTKDNKQITSPLYSELKALMDRDLAIDKYFALRQRQFMDVWYPKLTKNEFGEPSLKELILKTPFKKYLSGEQLVQILNKDISENSDNVSIGNDESIEELYSKESFNQKIQDSIQFNENSDYNKLYVAVPKVYNKSNEANKTYTSIEFLVRNPASIKKAVDLKVCYDLNNRLTDILNNAGVSIGNLSPLEELLGIGGVTDFSLAKSATQGLILLIRIAKGEVGAKALPEEFAHFALKALGDSPLVLRLLNNIQLNNIVEAILGEDYETYKNLYGENSQRLIEEAAGKLVSYQLTDILKALSVPHYSSFKGILLRVGNAIKTLFGKINKEAVENSLKQAELQANEIAASLLDNTLSPELNKNILESKDKLFNTKKQVDYRKELLLKIVDQLIKKMVIYETRSSTSREDSYTTKLINELLKKLDAAEYLEGIEKYASDSIDSLKSLLERIVMVRRGYTDNGTSLTINQKAKVLNNIRNELYSFNDLLKTIQETFAHEKIEGIHIEEQVLDDINKIKLSVLDLFTQYKMVGDEIFIGVLKPFVGEGIEIPFGKYKGQILTAENIFKTAEDQTSVMDRWFLNMADSSDYILKIYDIMVKQKKEKVRQDTIKLSKQIEAAGTKLRQSGVKDFDWMYEKYDGNNTGYYITQFNLGKYEASKSKMLKDLNAVDKNGIPLLSYNEKALKKREWFSDNTLIIIEKDGNKKRVPRMYDSEGKVLYANPVYLDLSKEKREFLDTFNSLKAGLDAFLPPNMIVKSRTIKIRKDVLERLSTSKGGNAIRQIIESAKDSYLKRADDTDFQVRKVMTDFEGKKVLRVPVYYLNIKDNESENDISTDPVSTLIAYADMANNYKQLSNFVDTLELGRDLMKDSRQVKEKIGGKDAALIIDRFKRKIVENLTVSSSEKRFLDKLDDLMNIMVYNEVKKDEGNFGNSKVSKAKTIDTFNTLTSIAGLSLNLLAGISNVATATVMLNEEAIGKQFFTAKNLFHGDKIYRKNIVSFMNQIGKNVKTNKLALFDLLFNVLQDYQNTVKDTQFSRKSRFGKAFSLSSLFFLNNCGDHWIYNRAALAMADAYTMKDNNGNKVSLWDALEVKPLDKDNPSLGATLEVKDGYTKLNGYKFTLKDITDFSLKIKSVNASISGNYNKMDKGPILRYALGRSAFVFRQYLIPNINRMFKAATYNFETKDWSEGYYRTGGRFFWQIIKELRHGLMHMLKDYRELGNQKYGEVLQANIRRTLSSVALFVILAFVIAALFPDDDDTPKDEKSWFANVLEYQLRRLKTELGALTVGPSMIDEGLKLLKSPAAGINQALDIIGLIGIVYPAHWLSLPILNNDPIIQSGKYKGMYEGQRDILKSPLSFIYKPINATMNPEEGIPFYKQ